MDDKKNGYAIAGFIFALIAVPSIFFRFLLPFSWFFWVFGLVFSLKGVLEEPRFFAVCGLVITAGGIVCLFLAWPLALILWALAATCGALRKK